MRRLRKLSQKKQGAARFYTVLVTSPPTCHSGEKEALDPSCLAGIWVITCCLCSVDFVSEMGMVITALISAGVCEDHMRPYLRNA
jgi:hypothetical protein